MGILVMKLDRTHAFFARLAFTGVAIVSIAAGISSAQPPAAPLATDAERKWLAEISPVEGEQILAHLAQMQRWHATWLRIRDDLSRQPVRDETVEELVALATELAPLAQHLGRYSDSFVKLSDRLKKFEAEVQAAKREAEESVDRELERLRNELIDPLRADIERILKVMDELRNPLQFARQFLEKEIEQNYFDKPYQAGDLTFILKREGIDRNRSLFSPEANITVLISYGDQIEAEARGLYFRYRDDGVPEPVLDSLTVDASQLEKRFASATFTSLANALPADLGLPIQIKNPRFLGMQPAGPKNKRGGLQFGVEIKFSQDLPAVRGDELVLYPDGDFALGKIGFDNPTFTAPLGTTPFAFQGIAIEYAPNGDNDKPPEISGTTRLSTTGTAQAYALELTLRVALPVKKIELEGNLILLDGNVSVAWVETTLDFTDGSLSGQYAIPGKPGSVTQMMPIADVLRSEGTFRLDGKGFVATGNFQLYGQTLIDAQLGIMFNGHGYLTAGGGVEIFGTRVDGEFNAGYTPGFREFWLDVNLTVKGISLAPWGELDVTVGVYTNQDEGGLLWLYADAGVVSVSVPVPDALLTSLTLPYLAKLLEQSAVAAYHQFLDDMAREEKNGREWAATQERNAKNWLDEHFGFTGSTGIPELDALGGRFSDGAKEAGGVLADWRRKTGSELTQGRENVQGFFKNPGGTTSSELQRWGRTLGF
jgi:hypothetical protein